MAVNIIEIDNRCPGCPGGQDCPADAIVAALKEDPTRLIAATPGYMEKADPIELRGSDIPSNIPKGARIIGVHCWGPLSGLPEGVAGGSWYPFDIVILPKSHEQAASSSALKGSPEDTLR